MPILHLGTVPHYTTRHYSTLPTYLQVYRGMSTYDYIVELRKKKRAQKEAKAKAEREARQKHSATTLDVSAPPPAPSSPPTSPPPRDAEAAEAAASSSQDGQQGRRRRQRLAFRDCKCGAYLPWGCCCCTPGKSNRVAPAPEYQRSNDETDNEGVVGFVAKLSPSKVFNPMATTASLGESSADFRLESSARTSISSAFDGEEEVGGGAAAGAAAGSGATDANVGSSSTSPVVPDWQRDTAV